MTPQPESAPQLPPKVEVPMEMNLSNVEPGMEPSVVPNLFDASRLPKSEIEILGSLDQYMTAMSRSQLQSTLQSSGSLCSNVEANNESFKRMKQNLESSRNTKPKFSEKLEKTIHDDKAVGRQFMQEKALRKYEEYLQTWGDIGERLANKTGKVGWGLNCFIEDNSQKLLW